jgi:hypothetical protein
MALECLSTTRAGAVGRTVPSLWSTASHGWAMLEWNRALSAACLSASDTARCNMITSHTRAHAHAHAHTHTAALRCARAAGLTGTRCAWHSIYPRAARRHAPRSWPGPVYARYAVHALHHVAHGSPLGR